MDSTININLVPKDEIKVFYGTEAHIDNKASVLFIKSGQAEIQNYVDNVSKPEISNYVETEAKPLATQIIKEIAEPTVDEYIETTVKPDLDEYADSLKPDLQAYVTQASNYADNSQASATASAGSAAASLTSANNAKTSETNAKTYENNALSSKNAAASSATSASNYANNSKIWAEGTDSQVQALGGTHSSKGWAEEMDVNNFVHKTGNETIAGDKTFTGNIIPSSVLFKRKTGGANQGFLYQNSSGDLYFGLRNSGNTEFMNNFSFATDGSITVRIGNSATNKAFIVPNPATSDNSTKAATTNWVRSLLNSLYPVGSLFFSTAGTCPLQSLGIGTWNKVGTSLTLSVNTSVPVKGNGLTLGLTNGSQYTAPFCASGLYYGGFGTENYGQSVGTNFGTGLLQGRLGVTTDSSKSGIVGTLTRTQITVNVFQRTA